jgi:hypothetical protein
MLHHQDKFLLGIIIGVVGLITITFLIIQNSGEITYQSSNTPEAVVHDFLLALNRKDYEIAYSLISTQVENYPKTIEDFEYDMQTNRWTEDSYDSFSIKDVISGPSEATVIVSLIEFYQGDLFNSGESTFEDQFVLKLENSAWKIFDSSYFFPYCWSGIENCRER